MSSEESKLSILKAAIQAFSTKGFDSVSIRDIAAEAGVNHAIIRYHYGSKENLWMVVFQQLMEQVITLRKTAPFDHNNEDYKTEFRNFIKSRVTYTAENPQLLKIILLELIEGGPRFNQIDMLMRKFFQGSLSIVNKMQEKGLIKDLKMKDLFFILPGFIGGRFLYPNNDKDFDGNPIALEDAIEAHTDLIMQMIYKQGVL